MQLSRTSPVLISLPLLIVAAFGGVVFGAEAKLAKVRFVQSGHTAASWPVYVAQEKKILEKNGIFLEVIIIQGATNTTRAVLSETVPIGRINPDYVIGAIEKGAKVRIVSGNMEKFPTTFSRDLRSNPASTSKEGPSA